ncbi:restriction endonuclease subunit S [Acetobacter thailandicus]|uniref:Restriction endonuclease subunit S n=1 Tax=Acetobacter thailandicus TaxID=1502842 RepID=A0ABT3QCG0_9PROT|nr:restriction endonuclease subunit S [Acetobacter thailandicus]MCX2562989.1 restriction endonuclease subunit S [Acetobacter thailandicus]NHN96223.1 restriction endonuclease subunit S [Acetobacter thailandicus]
MNIAAYPKYDSYQDVKISWCEELPSHWTTQPIRNLFTESRRKNGAGKNKDYLSLMANRGIIPYSEKGDVGNKMPADLSGCKLVDVDDFVLNSMNFGIGSFGVSSLKGVCSSVYVILKANNPASIRYYERIFQHPQFQTFSQSLGNGILAHRCAIGWDELKNSHFPVPPVEEIQAIAAFLDGKCTTIDEAVRIKEEQIRLLAERRQILIQQAVIRGLNPDAPMKDSGIDWIGQIPAHWVARRNFALFRETKNAGNAGLPVLSVSIHSGVSKEELSEEENIRSIIKIEDRSSYKEVLPGDIAYNMMRAWQGGIGAVHTHGMVSPAYVVARPIVDLVADYFELLYRTPAFIRQMDASSKGITDFRKRLYWDDFRDCLTIVPPKAEQEEIIRYSSDISAKFHHAISLKESQITALREYKTSLINAAVTGKIKVL